MSDITPTVAVNSSSVSALVTTLIVNGIFFLVFIGVFIGLRRRIKEFYEPRSYLNNLSERDKQDPLPQGPFSWILPLLKYDDFQIIEKSGLDAYFFIRYLKNSILVFVVGICLTWPILFPVYATGGAGQQGLNIIGISNLSEDNRYFATVFVTWTYAGLTLWLITREIKYFIRTRNAWILKPENREKLALKTMLIQSIPKEKLNEEELKNIFGPGIDKIVLNKDLNDLHEKVEDRDKSSLKLEGAETKLIKRCVKASKKVGAKEGEEKSNWATYFGEKKRPTHRLRFLIGKKVDSVNYLEDHISSLNDSINNMRQNSNDTKLLPSGFISYTSVEAANQAARKSLKSVRGFNSYKYDRVVGSKPEDIVWKNMRMDWYERYLRRLGSIGLITLMIIFWTIPVAFVGTWSNINYLVEQFSWLEWIMSIPAPILGIITGLLPAYALSFLMSLVPPFIKLVAKYGGAASSIRIELTAQNMFFCFLVIQVFLVTTFASSAVSVVSDVINDPSSATTLLAENIPRSSNFYISYFLVSGLVVSAGMFSRLISLFVGFVLGKLIDNTPRKLFKRFKSAPGASFGITFAVHTNLAIIAWTYSTIAPLVLAFSALAFCLLYFAHKYTILYISVEGLDTTGLVYGRAIWQSFTGIYLSEVCVLGLVALRENVAQIVLMAIAVGVTALYQIYLQHRYEKDMSFLPASVDDENVIESTDAKISNDSDESLSTQGTVSEKFEHVALSAGEPTAWIPEDHLGVSKTEIASCGTKAKMSDSGASLTEKAKLQVIGPVPS